MQTFMVLVVFAAIGIAAAVLVALTAVRRVVDARLAATDGELRRLADSAIRRETGSDEVRREVAAFRDALSDLNAREHERRLREQQSWEALQRVTAVLAGGQRAGRAGENVLGDSLTHLPPGMLERDFRVNGRVVEFGLLLPDGRRLPVDSKWPADQELQRLAETEDPVERERLIKAIERTVAERAREVGAYREPSLTAPICVAAVPDAAYAVLRKAHLDAYREGVVVISYSMALPVVLFLHAVVARFGAVGDVEACLTDLARMLDAVETTLENKVAKACTMLGNATDDMRGQIGKARTSLARARATEESLDAPVPPRLVEVR